MQFLTWSPQTFKVSWMEFRESVNLNGNKLEKVFHNL